MGIRKEILTSEKVRTVRSIHSNRVSVVNPFKCPEAKGERGALHSATRSWKEREVFDSTQDLSETIVLINSISK
jgi:hypothetical protein